jgi:hypothetical protein
MKTYEGVLDMIQRKFNLDTRLAIYLILFRIFYIIWNQDISVSESLNESEMDIKQNVRYFNLKKNISRHTLHQHWHTCPIALPLPRNPQHRSLLAIVLATSAPRRASSTTSKCPSENFSTKLSTALGDRYFTGNRTHFFMNTLCIDYLAHRKRTTELCSSVAYSSRTVAILITETSLWTWECPSVIKLDCAAI